MIIQHNIMAINSHRQLGINNTNLSGNLEKLSSGYRINRAADDASGLAVSEKMRAQITGLDRAILNAQDGASLIQTAEGALTEVHSMLNRMVELATQAANGTYQGADRQKIEDEVEALKEEIDRISQATNFNGIQLLDGSLSDTAVRDINVGGVRVTETAASAGIYSVAAEVDTQNLHAGDILEYTVALDNGDSFTARFEISSDGSTMKELNTGKKFLMSSSGVSSASITKESFAAALQNVFQQGKLQSDFIITLTSSNSGLRFENRVAGSAAPEIVGAKLSIVRNGQVLDPNDTATDAPTNLGSKTVSTERVASDEVLEMKKSDFILFEVENNDTNEDMATFEVNGQKFVILASGTGTGATSYEEAVAKLKNSDVHIITVNSGAGTSGSALNSTDLKHIAEEINSKTGLSLRINKGDDGIILDAPKGNGLTMQVGDTAADFNKITVSVQDMSASGLGIQNISMATQESASRALDRINAAIEKVSVNRGALGALQNRLTYTINNLGVTTENMTAAESRIRDVDMAKEMMAFTKNNVLSQAAQAMLAQANMQPQNVLQLLR